MGLNGGLEERLLPILIDAGHPPKVASVSPTDNTRWEGGAGSDSLLLEETELPPVAEVLCVHFAHRLD
jgi:hypothetical protein